MADNEDKESKTEEPTEKRISDAVEKGNVPMAREATLFGSIASTLAVALLLANWSVSQLVLTLQTTFAGAGTLRLEDREAAASFLASLLIDSTKALLPVMVFIAAGTIIASIAQNPPAMAGQRIAPQASRISLLSGWTRLYGHIGMVEFAKAVIKLLIVSGILVFILRNQIPHYASTLGVEPFLLPQTVLDLAVEVLSGLAIFALLLALADLVWSRVKWRRDLRMTRHEIKEEMKQSDGDPQIKARIRNIARQRVSRRMLEKLPKASMVIVNPTHYAVALRYAPEDGGAPVVVAKGLDHLALKIREIAAEHAIPVVENKPLARALYDKVEVDTQIPPEFYRAVAEIIHYLNSRKRLPRHSRPA